MTSQYTLYRRQYLRLWRCWARMHRRCVLGEDYCANISVAPEWQGPQGFVNFVDDLGDRPSEKHWLVRKDKSQDFTLSNVEWSTVKEDWRRRDKENIRERAKTLHKYRKNPRDT